MATRLYFTEVAPSISPAFDSSWEVTGSAVRRWLDGNTKPSGDYETLQAATASNTPAGAVDVLIAQYVSGPLSGAQTISGAIKAVVRAVESNSAADLRSQAVITVVSNDGSTVRGTLVASQTGVLASEWPLNTAANRYFPLGAPTTPTSVAAQDGDRIVVELGYRKHESATTSRTGTITVGAPNRDGDLVDNQTGTAAGTSWIEFADNLAFQAVETRVSTDALQVAVVPPAVETRVSLIALQVAVSADATPGSGVLSRAWGFILG